MAKRSTIGINPLDAQVQDNPLDAVVAGPGVLARSLQPPLAEVWEEAQVRLQQLEAGLRGLREENARLRSEMTSLRGELSVAKSGAGAEVAPLKSELSGLKAALAQLQADLAALKTELNQVKAQSAPGDIPWWMGGRKKR